MELNFRPIVYMRDRTHTYLWLRDSKGRGVFLTMESGTIERVSLGQVGGVYQVTHNDTRWELTPHAYDPILAFQKYHESLLGRSDQAAMELDAILSLEPGPKPAVVVVEKAPIQSTKPAKPPKASKGSKASTGGYTLADLCKELGIGPSDARKTLRNKKVEKPQGKWEWPSREAAEPARKALS